jgi:hypothetical protein
MTDPNKYKIVAERFTRYFDIETITLFEGGMLDNMQTLFEAMKTKQGPNLRKMWLVDEKGNELESYP